MHRIIHCDTLDEARKALQAVGVSSQGIDVMAPKTLGDSIRLTSVRLGAANILKQEMLSLGGDAAVARGVVDGKADFSDVLLLGGLDKYRKLVRKLDYQRIFGLPEIQEFLKRAIARMGTLPTWNLLCRGRTLTLAPTKIMGIINVTPDSFSDGGRYNTPDKAVEHARQLLDEGADILDLGGESTRPGSDPVPTDEEIRRLIPTIERIRAFSDVPISVDTNKAVVLQAALSAGADILNDITALQGDPEMISLLREYPDVPVVLMHMQGTPKTMQDRPQYTDVMDELFDFFAERLRFCTDNGIAEERIILDPGIGFGKNQHHNLTLLKRCRELSSFERPVLIGHSRKSFLGQIYPSPSTDRLAGTLAVTAYAFEHDIPLVRVHDVRANRELLATLRALREVAE